MSKSKTKFDPTSIKLSGWDQRSHYAPTGASNIVNQYSPAACVHVKQSQRVARKACCNKTQSVHVDDLFFD